MHFSSLVSLSLFILQQVWQSRQVGGTPLTGACSAAANAEWFTYPPLSSLSLSSAEATAAAVVSRRVCAVCVLQVCSTVS